MPMSYVFVQIFFCVGKKKEAYKSEILFQIFKKCHKGVLCVSLCPFKILGALRNFHFQQEFGVGSKSRGLRVGLHPSGSSDLVLSSLRGAQTGWHQASPSICVVQFTGEQTKLLNMATGMETL